ncbi:hypothetical protein AAHA92_29831 [Salvia divinorum]|uniref:Uncharacterized protein n=1 Tax=Salvia divinorum TaxID=28513 RepID=A0ABD1FZM5_SALDI
MEEEVVEILLPKEEPKPNLSRRDSWNEENIETRSYGSGLKWMLLDYSSLWRAWLSWSVFIVLDVGVPLVSHLVFSCSDCDPSHQRPFNAITQLSLSLFAAVSFLNLSSFSRKYGLRRFLFLTRLSEESEKVRHDYAHQLHRSMKLLSAFVLPCFIADTVYKIWWFSTGGNQIPYLYNIYLSKLIICILLMCSWLYRVSICFLVCVLFRLACYLHLLRLDEFAQLFETESDVAAVLVEHLSIRRNLRIISHRFRLFILSTLILVTISQFASLLVITEPKSNVNIATAGELALCSITLVTGLFICLRSAAKITHKAQAVTSLAAKWHACATISSFDEVDDVTPPAQIASAAADCDTDNEEGDGDDVLDNTNLVPVYVNTISYQRRQALVTYFEHNRAGITVYGFMLDRTWLHTIFAIQLSLTLWILNKTIGIS